MKSRAQEMAERLREAGELYEVGVAMLRSRLKRERPTATDHELDRAVQAWLLTGDENAVEALDAPAVQFPRKR